MPTSSGVSSTTGWSKGHSETDRYLAKLDYNLTDDHHFELTKLYDKTKSRSQGYGFSYATLTHDNIPGNSSQTTVNCCGSGSAPGSAPVSPGRDEPARPRIKKMPQVVKEFRDKFPKVTLSDGNEVTLSPGNYQSLLEIRVSRFEPDATGEVVLDCTWKLQPVVGRVAPTRAFSTRVTPAGPSVITGPQTYRINAMNEALARLARDIARSL